MTKTQAWIASFRLRTLPLSLSSVVLGSLLAAALETFHWQVFALTALTTLFLQVLSNLANDYGDARSGADSDARVGPKRALQAGIISLREMRNMIILFVLLAFLSGITLIFTGVKLHGRGGAFILFVVGVLSIFAAIKYTVGKKPYGYIGLGDIFVFIFFGLVGMLGTYFLHTGNLSWDLFLPAVSVGLLSVGVLNINNMRDKESDESTGKRTLAVLLGDPRSRYYHVLLIAMAFVSGILFAMVHFHSAYQFLFMFSLLPLIRHVHFVLHNEQPQLLDPQLKVLSISTLLFSLLFGVGFLLG